MKQTTQNEKETLHLLAIIAQSSFFSWREIEASPDLVRLERVIAAIPDEALMRALEQERKGRRDDYPLRAMWNALLAAIVFGHVSVASLLRELRRNAELRELCGFAPGAPAPTETAFSRFLLKLRAHQALIEAIPEALIERLKDLLPDLGTNLAIDGKAISTCGRNDPDANAGTKTAWNDAEGCFKEIKQWFGYKLHLVVDADHELPLAWEVTQASTGESPRLMPLIESLEEKHPALLERTRALSADRGYDDGKDKAALFDAYSIRPIMDTRDMGRGQMKPLDETRSDTIYTGPTGEVCCKVSPFESDPEKAYARMFYMGFEKDRQTLKYRCPAAAFGLECRNRASCRCRPQVREGAYGRVVRVPLLRDRRVFLPVPRHSPGFEDAYKKRTAVERVNARIDQVYGFERHFIRGLANMRLRVSLAMAVMLAAAAAWIDAGKPERMRSLVRAA